MDVALFVKRTFEDVIRLRGSHPGLSGWAPNLVPIILIREMQRKQVDRRGGDHVKTEAEAGGMWP